MKRRITSKDIKKGIWGLVLITVVVLLMIVIINSFSRGNINSNNTALNNINYSGEYRTYLEEQVLIKKYVSDGTSTLEEKVAAEFIVQYGLIDSACETKKEEIQALYVNNTEEHIKKTYNKTVEEYLQPFDQLKSDLIAAADAEKAEIDENASYTEDEKVVKKAAVDAQLALDIKAQVDDEIDAQLKQYAVDLEVELEDADAKALSDKEALTYADIIAILALQALGGRTLSQALNDIDFSPGNYQYDNLTSLNHSITADFDKDASDALNSNPTGSVANDTYTGYSFTNQSDSEDVHNYIYSGKSGSLVYNVKVTESGFYNIVVEYIPATSAVTGFNEESGGAVIERKIMIDNKVPYADFENISFSRMWGDGGKKLIDAVGNEIKPKQIEIPSSTYTYLRDSIGYITEPYLVYFEKGDHTITIESIRENMGIADVYVATKEMYISYADYKAEYADAKVISDKIAYQVQGEGGTSLIYQDKEVIGNFDSLVIRSSSTIFGVSDRVSAYNSSIKDGKEQKASPVKLILNSIGGSKWKSAGDWISWTVDVKESGLYEISLRAKQNISRGLFSTRKLSIDGKIPFNEAQNCKFVYKSNWSIVSLGDANGDVYSFYLEAGKHTITMEVSLGDYAGEIERVQGVIDDLNALYRKIIQRTGISPDPYIDYFKSTSGKNFIAQAKVVFQESIKTLNEVSANITKISGEKSSETSMLETMAVQLDTFIKDYRKIQKSLSNFSNNISSLGTWIITVSEQSLSIDYLLVHSSDYKLPRANPNFFGGTWFSIKGFVMSFFFDYESVGMTETRSDWETVEVWLCTSESQGREQANAISSMIYNASNEAENDPTHILNGINIVLKVVSPDVLLTATLAGKGPDVAINIGNGTPVNYALRGATYDISQFTTEALEQYYGNNKAVQSFQEIALDGDLTINGGTRRFQSSAMTPYYFENGYYALPYTQSFLMLFYRTDMFDEYGWDIPKTWKDVINLVPELQIMNFQFYLPLNQSGAISTVNSIFASYLYQNVEDTTQAFYRKQLNEYGEEYLESNFDSEEAKQAFEFWCGFYADYKFPLAASFVNRFRSGETPIGIVGYDMYNTLAVSAPEIRGKWSFAVLPGTQKVDVDGNKYIDNSGAASGTALAMMATTDHPYESWAFMEWFTRADTQTDYAREIEAILGSAARHNTANVEAFTRLAWTTQEIKVLLEQWKYTVGVPEVAGGYYTGRNLENAFRWVVNNNANPRATLSDYILTINSEIDRKREEFGLATSKKASTRNK